MYLLYVSSKWGLVQDTNFQIPLVFRGKVTHCFSIKSPFGESNIDGCAENWWDSLEEIKRDFDGEVMKSQLDDREGAIDAVYPSYFQGIWSDENIIKLPG